MWISPPIALQEGCPPRRARFREVSFNHPGVEMGPGRAGSRSRSPVNPHSVLRGLGGIDRPSWKPGLSLPEGLYTGFLDAQADTVLARTCEWICGTTFWSLHAAKSVNRRFRKLDAKRRRGEMCAHTSVYEAERTQATMYSRSTAKTKLC